MAVLEVKDVADRFITYEARVISFKAAHPNPKRRTSAASSKATKTIKWPHKFLTPEDLANAGFFYHPSATSPDNVACFLCHRMILGWEEDDDPLTEHLKLSPDCGWAIVASIAAGDQELKDEYPMSSRMIDARKATFQNRWPHEGKKGWKCKIKQMVEAGWKYTPTPEYDDTATCVYCELALDGWDPTDKPMDEHHNRSPSCPFFTLISEHKPAAVAKGTKVKKGRASKASRISSQSSVTILAEEASSFADMPAEQDDSVLTTATDATLSNQTTKKGTRSKKAGSAAGRKAKVAKESVTENVAAPEPEDDDFSVKVDQPTKTTKSNKRTSDQMSNVTSQLDNLPPPPKRRTTRTRGSILADSSMNIEQNQSYDVNMAADADTGAVILPQKASSTKRKGRTSTAKSARNVSTASTASLRMKIPDDDELDKALEADLDRPLTEDEHDDALQEAAIQGAKQRSHATKASTRNRSRQSKAEGVTQTNMFSIEHMEIDEAAIDTELQALEIEESKSLPKAKGARGQPRKASAKQKAAQKPAALPTETEPVADIVMEEAKPEESVLSAQDKAIVPEPAAILPPKTRRVVSRQLPPPTVVQDPRLSLVSINDSTVSVSSNIDAHADESGNETDASVASQPTVVRGGGKKRGSTLKKANARGKKTASRKIEDIIHKEPIEAILDEEVAYEPHKREAAKAKKSFEVETNAETVPASEAASTPADEPSNADLAAAKPKRGKAAAKSKAKLKASIETAVEPAVVDSSSEGSSPTAAAAPAAILPPKPQRTRTSTASQAPVAEPTPRPSSAPQPTSPTPPPAAKELTPSPSPQSSDAENQPPSSKPSAASSRSSGGKGGVVLRPLASLQQQQQHPPATPRPAAAARVPLAETPGLQLPSPSKRNVIAGALQSAAPWTAVDVEAAIFAAAIKGGEVVGSNNDDNGDDDDDQDKENGAVEEGAAAAMLLLREARRRAAKGLLSERERTMSVEEWVAELAGAAEEGMRLRCEAMVGAFEQEGGRAMRALEGIMCRE